jgi:hypothetical protein
MILEKIICRLSGIWSQTYAGRFSGFHRLGSSWPKIDERELNKKEMRKNAGGAVYESCSLR